MCSERKNSLSVYKTIIWVLMLIFSAYSIYQTMSSDRVDNKLLAVITPLLVSMPFILGRIMKFKLGNGIFTFLELYIVGAILGSLYSFYDSISWWDDMLHFCGGVVFAMFGYYVVDLMNKGNNTLLASISFAICFSVLVSVVWEFYEFGCDTFFHTDMQRDTLVNGNLDIGLMDTMRDMLFETGGAIVFGIYALIDKNRHPIFRKIEE